jgi:L-lactate dehydrogenase complex protein LldE
MVDDKIERILATGAQIVTSGDIGCLMNIGGMISRGGYPVRAVHLAEILAGGAEVSA